jgi:radical SAM superfamily enzyme YgiQ (UPF0313 family)
VLFTTSYIRDRSDIYNWMSTNVTWKSLLHAERRISAALRFIKQNIPGIEIMEYPTWEQYVNKLKEGWDIVGFSFYLNEVGEVRKMIDKAREMGIKEIWGGNYGVLTKAIQPYFDRIFTGYAEHEIAKALGHEIKDIIHPPLVIPAGLPNLNLNWMGVLFTTRGCAYSCRFCQSPSFANKVTKIPLESIERVLAYYKEIGLGAVVILDEFFGMNSKHANEVVNLLKKYNMFWWAMTRADLIYKKLDQWDDGKLGLGGLGLGLESFNQEVLEKINKKAEAEEIIKIVKELHERNIGIIGYYMIGFDNETPDSIKQDLKRLGELKIDATQICIITPLPETPLWDEISEKYGIFEKDYRKFNAKHLVWNHPTISPTEMEELLHYGFDLANPRRSVFRRLEKIIIGTVKTYGYSGVGSLVKNVYRSNVVYGKLKQPILFDNKTLTIKNV